jgi:hypothetical protein
MMNWKGFERSGSGITELLFRNVFGPLNKTTEKLRIVNAPAEIGTERLALLLGSPARCAAMKSDTI